MPQITPKDAVEKLLRAVNDDLEPSRLLWLANYLYRDSPLTPAEAAADPQAVAQRVAGYIRDTFDECGAAELPELWRLVFDHDRGVWYNEEEDLVRYNEEEDLVRMYGPEYADVLGPTCSGGK